MVGSAIVRYLRNHGYNNLILKNRSELDLVNQNEVDNFFKIEKPEFVFLAAAKVGGIHANNTYPAEFIYQNLMIQNNIIHQAYLNEVNKLLFLGSSCVYPKESKIPITEDQLLSNYLEKTNEAYAIAKISGIKMCEFYNTQYNTNFISVMPTNLYGPNDNYDHQNSHVLAALIQKFVLAKHKNEATVTLWGTGKPLREFLHVDDLAEACIYLMDNYSSSEIINIGTGKDISILELGKLIARLTEFDGEILHDLTKPDGTYQKTMDITKLSNLGWKPKINLNEGIKATIEDFRNTYLSK
ncbi:MAG: GDP-L-fucose synthase [Candidatus Heimdallarchaeota archaeon]|nr:GDP-L-fucose synthase [Candidatus Heimdallarchaeota archaeon]